MDDGNANRKAGSGGCAEVCKCQANALIADVSVFGKMMKSYGGQWVDKGALEMAA